MTQPDPVTSLMVAGVIAVALMVLFWAGNRLFRYWTRGIRVTSRVLLEDALKHLFDCEYNQHTCTIHSLSGALALSPSRATQLLEHLDRRKLARTEAGQVHLTSEGRKYALRVVRTHRLWEHHLARNTGIGANEWHSRAEHLEHSTSPEETEALASRMGHPRYDPHGDPIPTAAGEIVPPPDKRLTDIPLGSAGEIVHIEDEPEAIFAQLVREGLYPGMRVVILESGPETIRFQADGREHLLAPVLAGNVSLVPLAGDDERLDSPPETLSDLELGERAEVLGFSPACRGPERSRMLDLGLIPGTRVEAELRSPSGDPVAFRLRGSLMALRKEQASLIWVKRLQEART